jgi:NADPH-dependent ferric siderophore reductase
MSKSKSRCISVVSTQRLSANMQRIVFSGDDLGTFPTVKPGAYIKLMFNQDGSAVTDPLASDDVIRRTYTVREFDLEARLLTLDFVLHDGEHASGPASNWAMSAKVGDQICFGGPGSIKDFPEDYDWVLFAGDITALPAIESHLALLPKETVGFVIVAIQEENDIRELVKPDGVTITWLTDSSKRLADVLSHLERPAGKPALWAASEFSQMRELRSLFKDKWQVHRTDYYLSSYWKIGRSEDQHKQDKRNDALKEGAVKLYNKAKQVLTQS